MQTAFIGGGHMASALLGGALADGVARERFVVAEPLAARREWLRQEFAVRVVERGAEAAADAEVLVLAVKPQQMPAVAVELAAVIGGRRRLLVSVAAGLRCADLARAFGPLHAIVRSMPNRPALIRAGITALYAGPEVDAAERARAEAILRACGETVWLDEERQLDAVTAVSGSGPAYFFLVIEALEAAGIGEGLSPEVARRLAIATAHGAGLLARQGPGTPAELRESVTSRGGTTAAALAVLEGEGLRAMFARAVAAATRRSAELGAELAGR
jgi:pyrroline-5-carboxylate reductase